MGKRLLVYGAGNRGKNICQHLLEDEMYEIVGVIDANPQIVGTTILDKFEVMPVEMLKQFQQVPICITIQNDIIIQSVRKMLSEEYALDLKNEIFYESIMWEICERKMSGLKMEGYNRDRRIVIEAYLGLGLGGIETWTKGLGKGLLNRGYENVHIMTDSDEYLIPKEMMKRIDLVKRESFYNTEDTYKNYENIVNYLVKDLPCTIVVNRPNVALMAACSVKRAFPDKIKIISVIHTGTGENYRRYSTFKDYIDLFVGVSSDIRTGMIVQGIASERVETMTCPFMCASTLERTYSIDNKDAICIGYAGRLENVAPTGKRMDLMLALAEELAERRIHFKLELAGDGPGRAEMERLVNKKRLENNVFFLGPVDHNKIHEFWRSQDICINLSDFEGRSLSIIEAMGNGAVPVVTMTSGVRDDIVDGVNGYIVPLGCYMEMADKIQYLAERRAMLEQMGKAAHNEVYPKSLLETHIDFWEKIL